MMFFFMLLLGSFISGSGLANKISCNDKERLALLDFKANLADINNTLNDWGDKAKKDCCRWVGVRCNNETGHVTELDLSTAHNGLSGNISSLLPLLSQLQHLDLSRVDFQLNHLPSSLSSLTNLQYLNFSTANISGPIPHQLANLPELRFLDLSSNLLSGLIPASFGDFTSITVLDLSRNQLEGVIPKSFENRSSLIRLDLSRNLLNGPVPNFAGCSSSISHSPTSCASLHKLDLSRNKLTGNLPSSVGKLSNLEYLDVSSNSLEGLISDDHFLYLTQLSYLGLSFNSFTINLSFHAMMGINLETIKMQSCKLGPGFPMWIRTQRNFTYLDISDAIISDLIPGWFWDLPYRLKFLNLSSNDIKGMLPNMTSVFQGYPGMDLSYNQLEGMIPVLPSKLAALNLSGNRFSGTLSFLCQIESALTLLDLSNNLLSGSLPDCWQKFQEKLVVLNLSNNNLSGEMPSSLGSLSQLQAFYLRGNAFIGEVPMSLSNCSKLRFVDLGGNQFSGNIPAWIGARLSNLYVLVLESNRFNGSIPSQICLLNKLQFLDLSKNTLFGNIPWCIGNLTAMATRAFQDVIMSHSYSYYVATVPKTKLTELEQEHKTEPGNNHISYRALVVGYPLSCIGRDGRPVSCEPDEEALFIDNALVSWKGTRREFGRGLYLLKSIDISSNKLYGKLPSEITNLRDLVSLNLSINKLHGQVPKHMGQMRFLESLDLSRNEFSGNIPSSLSQLTYLSWFDLSYNNLSGRIPLGTQLQFSNSSYFGNPQLCGPPLTKSCGPPPLPTTVAGKEDAGDELWQSYYTGMGGGFVVGFFGICGALIINRRCRYVFFASLNHMKDWIYVTTVVHFRNLHTKFRR